MGTKDFDCSCNCITGQCNCDKSQGYTGLLCDDCLSGYFLTYNTTCNGKVSKQSQFNHVNKKVLQIVNVIYREQPVDLQIVLMIMEIVYAIQTQATLVQNAMNVWMDGTGQFQVEPAWVKR